MESSGGSASSVAASKITKPPGGETNEIFTTPNGTPPSTPRKVKNYMASNIFTPDVGGDGQRAIRHRPDDDSFKRLFGQNGESVTDSPRRNHMKSNIATIFCDTDGKATTNGKMNGTNGHGHTNGHNGTNGQNGTNGTNGHNGTNGTNGHEASPTPNGTNGHSNGGSNGVNGDHKTNGTNGVNGTNGTHAEPHGTPGKRIPPGGYSTKLW